jgi:hypothetical protein
MLFIEISLPIIVQKYGGSGSVNRIKKYRGRSHLQSEINSKIVLVPRIGAITKADPLEVDPTVK